MQQTKLIMKGNKNSDDSETGYKPKRYSYSTVGYVVFSLLGEKYRTGRIEIYDQQDESGYAIDEGTYWMPHDVAAKFEDVMDSLETDLPIQINIGSIEQCSKACAIELGVKENKLNDKDTINNFYKEKYEKQ